MSVGKRDHPGGGCFRRTRPAEELGPAALIEIGQ
jgi:hypothetical protein